MTYLPLYLVIACIVGFYAMLLILRSNPKAGTLGNIHIGGLTLVIGLLWPLSIPWYFLFTFARRSVGRRGR